MIFQKQIHPHLPEAGLYGDCFRTCVACLLDLEVHEVPHFFQIEKDTGDDADILIRDFLATRGLMLFRFPVCGSLERITEQMEASNGRAMYMLQGRSPRGEEHVVIYKGADLLWDPAPGGKGIIGPGTNDVFWIILLMPSTQRWNGSLPPCDVT